MICSFKCKDTELIWLGIVSRRLPRDIQDIVRRKLRLLNNAQCINDLRIPPKNRLESLKGLRKGQYSIRVNAQWRLCFIWLDGIVTDVELIDYH